MPDRLEIFPETKICTQCSDKYGSDISFAVTKVALDIETYIDLIGATRS